MKSLTMRVFSRFVSHDLSSSLAVSDGPFVLTVADAGAAAAVVVVVYASDDGDDLTVDWAAATFRRLAGVP